MKFLEKLYKTIVERKDGSPDDSYVASLFSKGKEKIAKKVAEEATEVVIANTEEDKEQIIYESADLMFHLMVLLAHNNIDFADVVKELERREGVSGIEEKKSRVK